MRRPSYRAYFLLLFASFCILSLPPKATESLRSFSIGSLAPSWHLLSRLRFFFGSFQAGSLSLPSSLEAEKLRQENQILHEQIASIREWLLFEDRVEDQLQKLQAITKEPKEDLGWKEFFERRSQHLCEKLDLELQSLPAKVIFREPAFWSSFAWINVGENENEAIGKTIIAKNSPVIIGSSIVGVVEQVEKKRARIRLITDSMLVPSVRAVRGGEQERLMLHYIDLLLSYLRGRENAQEIMSSLLSLKQILSPALAERYLAKGELHGSGAPLWRSRSPLLKGVGFNYDFADEEGVARDIRSPQSLVQKGDLLITTGMDGVFPPGFHVAIVSEVYPLKEGASAYELQAKATAGNLEELVDVFVLPPITPK